MSEDLSLESGAPIPGTGGDEGGLRDTIEGAMGGESPQAGAAQQDDIPGHPEWWKPDHAEHWQSLNPAVREMMLEREQKLADDLKRVERWGNMDQIFTQDVIDNYARNGTSPEQAIQGLIAWERLLAENPSAGVQKLMQVYGIQPQQIMPQQQAGQPQNQGQQVLQQIVSRLQQLEGGLTEAQMTPLKQQIAQFSDGKEHFEAVRPMMGALMQSGQAQTLDEAYDMACMAHPEVRKAIQAEQAKAAREKDAQTAAKAKASAVSAPGGASAPIQSPANTNDLRATIAAAMGQQVN